jgi:small subunit ribosomal protein S8
MSSIADPIADMLARIRNAAAVHHETVLVPSSRLKLAIARILKEEGFVRDLDVVRAGPQHMIKVRLVYDEAKEPLIKGLKRVSKPGLRIYVGHDEVPRLMGGLGLAILSTPQGVMTGREARRRRVGGELLCYVW